MTLGWLVDGGERNKMLYRIGSVHYPVARVSVEELDRIKRADRAGRPMHFCQIDNEGSFQIWPRPEAGGYIVRYHV